jgi:pimeloyl-ACP methyl ester carboxylesterase
MTTLIIIVAILGAGAVFTLIGARRIERANPPRGRTIEVRGLRQHIVELEPRADDGAPPVVLVHGAGANLEDMCIALSERLAQKHRIIAVDRPGFGWSERAGRGSSSPAYQAEILHETLDKLGVDKAVLVGHSWGGTLALTYALNYPQRVRGLVLIAPPTQPPSRLIVWNNAVLATPIGWLFAHTLALPFGAVLLRPGVKLAFLPQAMPSGYVERSASALILRPASLMANWADVGGMHYFLKDEMGRYPALAVPTSVFVGDRDPLVPHGHCNDLAAMSPNVKVTVLPGFGHMLHHDAADQIVAAVEELAGSK